MLATGIENSYPMIRSGSHRVDESVAADRSSRNGHGHITMGARDLPSARERRRVGAGAPGANPVLRKGWGEGLESGNFQRARRNCRDRSLVPRSLQGVCSATKQKTYMRAAATFFRASNKPGFDVRCGNTCGLVAVPEQICVLSLQLMTALTLVWIRPLTHSCLRHFSL